MTTAITQGVRCGNRKVHGTDKAYHASTAEVRACYEIGRMVQPVSAPPVPAPSQAPRNLDEARTAAAQRLAAQNSPYVPRQYPASDKQVAFYTDLVREVFDGEALERALAKAETLSGAEAKALITDLLEMRKSQRAMQAAQPAAEPTPAKGVQGWRKLITEVMGTMAEANFAIEDEDGKTRFYRISKRGSRSRRPGTWKIQERVTDMLLPRSDALMSKVLPAILEMGVEASGKMFFERMHACYKCGASLTDDTGNPYYAMGLGPECGAK